MRKFIIISLLIPLVCFGQKKIIENSYGIEICLAVQKNSFSVDLDAENVLERILKEVGLQKNFSLVRCDNIDNALAITYKGERYILYDKGFINNISLRTNNWSSITILAHEVGHHLNNHALDLALIDVIEPETQAKKRQQELEADEFAGFVMARLGAPLKDIRETISIVSNVTDDPLSTHPSRRKRLESITKGYYSGINKKEKGLVYVIKNIPHNVPIKENPRLKKNNGRIWIYAGVVVATIIAILTIKKENPDQEEYDYYND